VANPVNVSMEDLRRAQQLAQTGDLSDAARICRNLLLREPANFFALLMLGGIESDRKNFVEAETLLERAVRINPRSPEALGSYGNVLIERGRLADAVSALTEALRLQPHNPATYVYRGFAHAQSGDHRKALADFDAAVRLSPDWEFALHNRACALIALYRHREARADIEKLLRRAPDNPAVLTNYGHVLTREGKHREALKAIDRALEFKPGDAGLETTRADILAALSRFDEALRLYQKLAQQQPDNPAILIGCANLLMEKSQPEEALRWVEKTLAADPAYAPAWVLRANLLLHLERFEESFATYDKAVAVNADYPEASYHRGSMMLLHGRFLEGWRDFERRWDVADCGFSRPGLHGPVWRGEPLNGRSIVIYSEQGLGDTIQFVRFLPLLQQTGARVTFLCHPMVIRLFQNFTKMGIEVVAACQGDRPFDYQCALMTMPERFGTTLETVPNSVPYIFPEAGLVEKWRERLGHNGLKVGICWQGNPAGPIDKGRSVPLAQFAALGVIPDVRLISLQRTHGLVQLDDLPEGMRVETVGPFDEGKDAFIDTAALMQSMDLIVTSDTSVAHLAGAVGRPVWLAIKHTPDWRWMLKRNDSPWYPTMRLFRQPVPGDWTSVFAEIATALEKLRSGEIAV
jgi:tetratricopeptide (TPR) repeat protein